MKRRLFWVAVGVGLTIFVIQQGRRYYQAMTPQGLSDQVSRQAANWSERIADFIDTFTEASAEREAELREAVGLDSEVSR